MSEDVKNSLGLIQDSLFKILCDIDNFCKKNNITYFLSGGTCLGAVRHQGFIPWDDDADIMMKRSDYERFIRNFGKAYPDKYGIGACEIDHKWTRPQARVWDKKTRFTNKLVNEREMGFFVDVFPIDGVPDGNIRESIFYKKLKALDVIRNSIIRKSFTDDEGHKFVKKVMHIFTRKLDPTKVITRINMEAMKYRYETSRRVGVSIAIHYGKRETIDKSYMEEAVYLPFRDKSFPVPSGYDRYLTNLYGDYMKIPKDKVENGCTHAVFWDIVEDDTEEAKNEVL